MKSATSTGSPENASAKSKPGRCPSCATPPAPKPCATTWTDDPSTTNRPPLPNDHGLGLRIHAGANPRHLTRVCGAEQDPCGYHRKISSVDRSHAFHRWLNRRVDDNGH